MKTLAQRQKAHHDRSQEPESGAEDLRILVGCLALTLGTELGGAGNSAPTRTEKAGQGAHLMKVGASNTTGRTSAGAAAGCARSTRVLSGNRDWSAGGRRRLLRRGNDLLLLLLLRGSRENRR